MFRRRLGRASGLLAFLFLVACSLVQAAEPKPEPADAEPTDPDYALQGEYVGEVLTGEGNVPVGVQLVALGKGYFRSVSYVGGLPGDNWKRTVRRLAEGALKDGAVQFSRDEYSSAVKDGVMAISLAAQRSAS